MLLRKLPDHDRCSPLFAGWIATIRSCLCHSARLVAQPEETRPVRVLIVDDHELFTEALRTFLQRDRRFEIVGTAATGREAVRAAKSTAVDVVLMDMSMPVLDGVAATRRLLALDPRPHVIAVTGHTDRLSRAAALEAGAAAYLTKAEAHEKLGQTIMDVCRGRLTGAA